MNNNQQMITLPRSLVNRLLTDAQSSPTDEICGLIGSGSGGYQLYPVNNIATDTQHRFEMEPAQQIAAMRQMREKGEELFAIYHSHPSAPAIPSPIDIKEASYPQALTLIISLNTVGVLELQGFMIDKKGVRSVEIEVVDS